MIKANGIDAEGAIWGRIAAALPHRNSKQCRERYHHHLSPDVDKSAWSDDEERILFGLQALLGNKWTEISWFLPRRRCVLDR
jgi:hypothetical protein